MSRESYPLWQDDAELSAGIDLAQQLTAQLSRQQIVARRRGIEGFCRDWFDANKSRSGTLRIKRRGKPEILTGNTLHTLFYLVNHEESDWMIFLRQTGLLSDTALSVFILALADEHPTPTARWLLAKFITRLRHLGFNCAQRRRALKRHGHDEAYRRHWIHETDAIQTEIERILKSNVDLPWKEVDFRLFEGSAVKAREWKGYLKSMNPSQKQWVLSQIKGRVLQAKTKLRFEEAREEQSLLLVLEPFSEAWGDGVMSSAAFSHWHDDAELAAGIELAKKLTQGLKREQRATLRQNIEKFCAHWFDVNQIAAGSMSATRCGVPEVPIGDVIQTMAYLAEQRQPEWRSFLKDSDLQSDTAVALFVLHLAQESPTPSSQWEMARCIMLLQRLEPDCQQQRRAMKKSSDDDALQRAIERVVDIYPHETWKQVVMLLACQPEVQFDRRADERTLQPVKHSRKLIWQWFEKTTQRRLRWWPDPKKKATIRQISFSRLRDRITKARKNRPAVK